MLEAKIIDRGRGPEIAGTRITVYDTLDYYDSGWHCDLIADQFDLSSRQVEVAIRYIEEHREKVMAAYQKIMERINRGNPPELQDKLDAGHERFLEMVKAFRETKSRESQDAADSGGH